MSTKAAGPEVLCGLAVLAAAAGLGPLGGGAGQAAGGCADQPRRDHDAALRGRRAADGPAAHRFSTEGKAGRAR